MFRDTHRPGIAGRISTTTLAAMFAAATAFAADHGDAPLISNDQGADIADVYAFLDPNDNDFLVTIITSRGFIPPGESENLGFFQDKLNWRFAIETTGDAAPDFNAEVTFSPRTGFEQPQAATVKLRQGPNPIIVPFTAPTVPSSATSDIAPPFVVTTDPASGISVFAGMTDDPFFFDVPAELKFRQSLIDSDPIPPGATTAPGATPEVFDRGIDTFSGFNVMSVALRIPLALVGGDNTFLGVSGYTEPTQFTLRSRVRGIRSIGRFVNVDRMGIPGINTVLVPYQRKDRYNRGSTVEDPAGVFSGDIIASLEEMKTSSSNINLLGSIAVFNGDMLRLDTRVENLGAQGGGCATSGNLCDAGPGGFPNGRRLADDPIDTIVNIISNQLFDGTDVDNVNTNDKPFMDTFPFLAPPHQPQGLIGP